MDRRQAPGTVRGRRTNTELEGAEDQAEARKAKKRLLRDLSRWEWDPREWRATATNLRSRAGQLREWAKRPAAVGRRSEKFEANPVRRQILLLAAAAALEAAANALALLVWVEPPDRATDPTWSERAGSMANLFERDGPPSEVPRQVPLWPLGSTPPPSASSSPPKPSSSPEPLSRGELPSAPGPRRRL